MIRWFEKVVDWLADVGACISGILIVAMVVMTSYEVVSRYIFNAPTSWSVELTTYAMIWAVIISATYALKDKRHIRVELLVSRLPNRIRDRLELITDVLGATVSLIFSVYGTWFVWDTYQVGARSTSLLEFPLFIPQLALPVSCWLLFLGFVRIVLRRTNYPAEGRRGEVKE